MSAFLSTIIVQCISVQFVITFKWDFVGKSTHTDDHTEAGGKAGDQAGAKVTTTLKGSMGERINKALYKVEEKKQKRAARRAQVSIREAGSGLVEGITICCNITTVITL